jgi:hypothetical protein
MQVETQETVDDLMANSTNALPSLLSRRVQAAPDIDSSSSKSDSGQKILPGDSQAKSSSSTDATLDSNSNGDGNPGSSTKATTITTVPSKISRANLAFMPSVLRSTPAAPRAHQSVYAIRKPAVTTARNRNGPVRGNQQKKAITGDGQSKKDEEDGDDDEFAAFVRDVESK